jgi:hypothetical protein
MWKSTQTEATPISRFVVIHLHASLYRHVFHLQNNFTNCDYVRFQVLKAVLRKIQGFRDVMPSRFTNRWQVVRGWRLWKQGLPNFGNCLPIETTSYTSKSLRLCLAWEVSAQSQINSIIILTVPVWRTSYFTWSSHCTCHPKENEHNIRYRLRLAIRTGPIANIWTCPISCISI